MRPGAKGLAMIRVKSVQIVRFRGIREGTVRDFADVNLLVGRNNSGKSTVVEAIHRLAYSTTGDAADPLNRRINVWTDARRENQPYPPELWYALDQTEPIRIAAEVGRAGSKDNESLDFTILVQGNSTRAHGS